MTPINNNQMSEQTLENMLKSFRSYLDNIAVTYDISQPQREHIQKALSDIWYKKESELLTLISRERAEMVEGESKVTGETSDGYHTFNELYEFRKLYNAGLFNEWAKQGKFNVHKSKKHSDGEDCFGGGWFIVTATLPTGQISNHYELKDWDLFQCEEREKADVWDGHTAQDVAIRLKQYLLERKKK